jgi:hypothetical protein|tara:strand:+ start:129 stop:416 length:288 start_codon:yes stop_codon:yes gene_type:complete
MSGDYETHDDRQPDISYIKEKTMSCNLRELTITSLLEQAQGEISKAKANVEIYLHNPVGIGEHPDVLGSIQDQLDVIAKAEERIDVINKHFIVHH